MVKLVQLFTFITYIMNR